jgi:hypothetical protein
MYVATFVDELGKFYCLYALIIGAYHTRYDTCYEENDGQKLHHGLNIP